MKSKSALRNLFALILLGVLVPAAFAQSTTDKTPDKTDDTVISPPERAFIAAKMYASIGMYFAHFQAIPDFDLDTSYQRFLAAAYKAPGRYEFDLACLEFIAQLKNGHTGFSDPWLRETYGQPFGFRALYLENQWVVSDSQVPALQVGDVIQEIDGKATETLFQENKRYIAGSNEREARTLFFAQRHLFPQRFEVTTGDGRKIAIKRLSPVSPRQKTAGKWLKEKQVAYIKIPGFDESQYEQDALKLVNEYQNAAALIVDLRGNGGGSTPGELIDTLMDRPYRSQAQATPIHIAVWKVRAGFFDQIDKDPRAPHDETYGYLEAANDMTGNAMYFQPAMPTKPHKPIYKGRVIVLIDRYVASAAEDFCIPFKDNHRGTFIGETSYGSTGQPYLFTFPNRMNFRISAKRDSFPDGSNFEGVGITPDREIPSTRQNLRSGKDPVLEAAIQQAIAP